MQEILQLARLPWRWALCYGRILKSWERGLAVNATPVKFLGYVPPGHRFLAFQRRDPPLTTGSKEIVIEKLWRGFFSDPSQWWDHRMEKGNPRYPDFKHKETQQPLWLDSQFTPQWVRADLAAIEPRTLQTNSFSWNKKLSNHAKAGQHDKTMELFQQMEKLGKILDKFTFLPVLNACASLRNLEEGRRIHQTRIIQSGCESDIYVGSCLVDMYAKCGSIEEACKVFNKMPTRNVVSWNSIILGHVKCGQGYKALELFREMHVAGLDADHVTFLGVLNACASLGALEEGRSVHRQIVQGGLESDTFIGNGLVDMYAKCGSVEDAQTVFNSLPTRDVVAWSALILGYGKCGQGQTALEVFQKMQSEGVNPDSQTFVAVLNACAGVGALHEGRRVHQQIIQRGFESDIFVGSSLVDMYAKCESIEDALRVFYKMPKRDVVAWSALIFGLVKCGEGRKALELYWQMQTAGVKPNPVTFVGVLNACAGLATLDEGQRVHAHIIQSGFESALFVQNSLVDMYANCGSLEDAHAVFQSMPTRDVVSWNAMLRAYSVHGHAGESVQHFEIMCQAGVQMDDITFVSLLSACSHAGLVEEGLHYFETMRSVYFISPTVEIYACMADLLGRAGHLHEAEDLIKVMMSLGPDATVWMSLLGACRVHGNVEMAEQVAKLVLNLKPEDSAGYVLLSDMYAASGK